jgi:hypothetical protein
MHVSFLANNAIFLIENFLKSGKKVRIEYLKQICPQGGGYKSCLKSTRRFVNLYLCKILAQL